MGNPGDTGWLILLYMLADDDEMYAAALADIEEMQRVLKRAGQLPPNQLGCRIVVVAQIERPRGRAQRYQLERDRDATHAYARSYDNAFAFAKTTIETGQYEDAYRLLVVWGHALGPAASIERVDMADDVLMKISAIKDSTLRKVVGLPTIDIVGFDACHLGNAEIATSLRFAHGAALRLLLAPQAGIGRSGWHYDDLLHELLQHCEQRNHGHALPPRELGFHVVEQVGTEPRAPRSLTLFDLGQVAIAKDHGTLVARLEVLTTLLQRAVSDPTSRYWVLDAFLRATWSQVRQFIDLADLCRHLAHRTPHLGVRVAAQRLLALLTVGRLINDVRIPLVLWSRCATTAALSGLSIYCPWPRATLAEQAAGGRNVEMDEGTYRDSDFNKATGWGDLMFRPDLMRYAERRMMREYVDARLDEYGLGHDRRALGGALAPLAGGEPKAGDKDAAFGSFPGPPPPPAPDYRRR